MNISTHTPEGAPSRCPICGGVTRLEPTVPTADAPCPSCDQLMWWCRKHLSALLGVPAEAVTPDTTLHDLGADSLDIVELVMELEEEFDVQIADEDAVKHMQTVADAVRYIKLQTGDRVPAGR